ncbi:hypothetical protein ZWY2020_054363 [Hordeum vulgare]|nr:hypothetical protein ZWY2020_054363 [Hordeum vulgare]
MMLVATEFGALSPPGAVVEATQRRWAPPSMVRVLPRGGSPVAVRDLCDFLEGGGGEGGDSRGSSDCESGGLHDLAHLADKISERTSRLHPVPRLLSSALLCFVRVDFAFWLWGQENRIINNGEKRGFLPPLRMRKPQFHYALTRVPSASATGGDMTVVP